MAHTASTITHSLLDATHSYEQLEHSSEELAKVYDLMQAKPSIDPDVGLVPEGRARGHILFEDVEFEYPGRGGAKVLKGASFEVQPGEILGMTGSAGCGKSTALRLLERHYDVTGGRILVDGHDLRDLSPSWLRSQIAIVSQEPQLLPISIRDNIAFGALKEPTLAEVEAACRAANILDAINDKNKFPEGLRTRMSTVQNVSGGEKQRIAIARAILADPPILLLDEATSALDEENQEKVQAALNELMRGRTTLVIAHRLSTIRDASKIVAFEEGKVVECGSHDELLKTSGSVYAKLWHKQCGPSVLQQEEAKNAGKNAASGEAVPTPTVEGAAADADASGGSLASLRKQVHAVDATGSTELLAAKDALLTALAEVAAREQHQDEREMLQQAADAFGAGSRIRRLTRDATGHSSGRLAVPRLPTVESTRSMPTLVLQPIPPSRAPTVPASSKAASAGAPAKMARFKSAKF